MMITVMMMIRKGREQDGGEQFIFEYIVMMTVIIKVDMTMTMMMMSMQSRMVKRFTSNRLSSPVKPSAST